MMSHYRYLVMKISHNHQNLKAEMVAAAIL